MGQEKRNYRQPPSEALYTLGLKCGLGLMPLYLLWIRFGEVIANLQIYREKDKVQVSIYNSSSQSYQTYYPLLRMKHPLHCPEMKFIYDTTYPHTRKYF